MNVNMLIRNSRKNSMKEPVEKNNVVSVLWIIFMFVCVIKKCSKKTFGCIFFFPFHFELFGH